MPKELVRVSSGICWCQTIIRPTQVGPETEIYFDVDGIAFSVAFDSIPDRIFLHRLAETRRIAIYEFSSKERNWIESGRYQVWINDDSDIDLEITPADQVRWGPVALS